MSLLIDGYNLMHAAGILGRGVGPGGLERSRLALLNFVVESVEPAQLPQTTVVFDAAGAPPGLPSTLSHGGVTVRFSRDYDDADELIEELILADTAPRRLTVVSSDHRLHRAAKRRKATAIDSDVWYRDVLRARQQRAKPTNPRAKPQSPLATSEVEFWLARFTEPPASPPLPSRRGPRPSNPRQQPPAPRDGSAETPAENSKNESAPSRKSPRRPPRRPSPEEKERPALPADDIFPPGYAEDVQEDDA